ncbi:hypothetical protein EVAR_42677_1 [Eumeta japonica]|uniref:Uncharacterized protein n=1 Tax=Eumeta variegata TaxID=151549 RepID=A0A4C1X2I0_EUMVA|nr:hypothetical protein EVAR_42677_1 [Eumeta japonica]
MGQSRTTENLEYLTKVHAYEIADTNNLRKKACRSIRVSSMLIGNVVVHKTSTVTTQWCVMRARRGENPPVIQILRSDNQCNTRLIAHRGVLRAFGPWYVSFHLRTIWTFPLLLKLICKFSFPNIVSGITLSVSNGSLDADPMTVKFRLRSTMIEVSQRSY